MKKIVLIEDDADLYALIQYNLEKEGFAMDGFPNRQRRAGVMPAGTRPDLVILDIMLPDSDGLDICKGIRAHSELQHIPVIFLTARASETDRIVGLELGANDYIVKPFFVRELIARIKIHFRGQQPSQAKLLKAGGWSLGTARAAQVCVWAEPGDRAHRNRVSALLEFLMTRPGVVFSREQLLDSVWGHDRAVTDRTVDVYILRLRQKIEISEGASFIRMRAWLRLQLQHIEVPAAHKRSSGTPKSAKKS